MLSEKYNIKVLEYSDDYASVYYVVGNETNGSMLTFTKIENKWLCQHWDTIWSQTESADDFVWPCFR